MKWMIAILPLIACTLLFAAGNTGGNEVNVDMSSRHADSVVTETSLASFIALNNKIYRSTYTIDELELVLSQDQNTQFLLGRSKEGRDINAYYIPGQTDLKAMVIAGVHGSELSAIEVTYHLINRLLQGDKPYYSVILIPTLFPDNAARAMDDPDELGSDQNIGRYSNRASVDPNRQMPSPGKAYNDTNAIDHYGRKIESENQLLLKLIQKFKPQRIASVHAIRDINSGGIYADPRTDHKGVALGYSSDSSLAVEVAAYIFQHGGNVSGNKLNKNPTALYCKDPQIAPAGYIQKRNLKGSGPNPKIAGGVSLGTWASTAVAGEKDSLLNRNAMRILTIEYPGNKRAADYDAETLQLSQQLQSEAYADAIKNIFLGNYYTEELRTDYARNNRR